MKCLYLLRECVSAHASSPSVERYAYLLPHSWPVYPLSLTLEIETLSVLINIRDTRRFGTKMRVRLRLLGWIFFSKPPNVRFSGTDRMAIGGRMKVLPGSPICNIVAGWQDGTEFRGINVCPGTSAQESISTASVPYARKRTASAILVRLQSVAVGPIRTTQTRMAAMSVHSAPIATSEDPSRLQLAICGTSLPTTSLQNPPTI